MLTDSIDWFFRLGEGKQTDEILHLAALQFIHWVNALSFNERLVFSILSMLLLTAGCKLSLRLVRQLLNVGRWWQRKLIPKKLINLGREGE